MENTVDFKAWKKWNRITKEFQQKIINNVFCVKCLDTTIVDYEIKDDAFGVLLTGKCKKCGGDVARLVEND